MAQTLFLGQNTSEPIPVNSLLAPGLLQPTKCLLLLSTELQLQNSCPAASKTSGRLLRPAEPGSLPWLSTTGLSKSSSRGGLGGKKEETGAAQRELLSVRSHNKPQKWVWEMPQPHSVSVPLGSGVSSCSPPTWHPSVETLTRSFPSQQSKHTVRSLGMADSSAVSSEDRA